MSIAMALVAFSPDTTKGILADGPEAREKYLRELFEARGTKILAYYYIEGGEWDQVVIVDQPDELANTPGFAVGTFLNQHAQGLYRNCRLFRLYTPAEVEAATKVAHTVKRPGND
jgi:uncharacterized protein with GYD domain